MTEAHASRLASIVQTVDRHLPALACSVTPDACGDVVDGADNAAAIGALHAHWRAAMPEGGPHLWSARCWGTLVWQPVYFAVLAVHVAHGAVALRGSGVRLRNGFAAGCCLRAPQAVLGGDPHELVAPAAHELRGWLDRLYAGFVEAVPIPPKMAMRLAADYVVAALLALRGHDALHDGPAIEAFARDWLEALDLRGASGVLAIGLAGGARHLALHRKVCCQEFRRDGGVLCNTCPKFPLDERIMRIRREAEGRVRAS